MSVQERAPLLKDGRYLFLFTSETLSPVKTDGCGSSIIQPRCDAKHEVGRKKKHAPLMAVGAFTLGCLTPKVQLV